LGLAITKPLTKWDIPSKTLATKFLEFLLQNGPSSWVQLERLVELDSRKSRGARTWKVLKRCLDKNWVEKSTLGEKKKYTITDAGIQELAHRKTSSLLTASAPFYFKEGLPLISFGEELTPGEQKTMTEIFSSHPRLRAVSNIVKGKIETSESATTARWE
jgi:DNA-binding PadR family transcriptional regulator